MKGAFNTSMGWTSAGLYWGSVALWETGGEVGWLENSEKHTGPGTKEQMWHEHANSFL